MKNSTLNSGHSMPILGLGTWKNENDVTYNSIRYAINIGYRLIDCADIYSNQREIGKAINDAIKENEVKREDLFIVSKLWNDSHRKDEVKKAYLSSLSEFNLDYLDLYLIHWPIASQKGDRELIPLKQVPLSETWEGMEILVTKNLVKCIGVSNYSLKKLIDMESYANIMPAINQIECHPFLAQSELINYAQQKKILIGCYSPLNAWTKLRNNGTNALKDLINNYVINEIATKHKCKPMQIYFSWAIAKNLVILPKISTKELADDIIYSLNIELDDEDLKKIATLDIHKRYIKGDIFYSEENGYTYETIWDEKEVNN